MEDRSSKPARAKGQEPENSFQPASRAEWREWLEQNHHRGHGIWLISYKKSSGKKRLDYEDVVEEALCFGWIDSTANRLDEDRAMLWMAPRKPRSGWSRPNKERVDRLMAAGLMATPGLAAIEVAKRNGSWTALDAVEALETPTDLATALNRFEHARGNFDAFPRSAKRAILAWIATAKRAETRAKRIEEAARLADQNIRANQSPRK